jgi:hypothetical protein
MKHSREESNDDSSMKKNMTADLTVPVWGGIECTVNRLGDRYNNQLARNGHMHRLGDLELI